MSEMIFQIDGVVSNSPSNACDESGLGRPSTRPLNQKDDPRRAIWLSQLKEENPDTPDYFLDFMIDTYLNNPEETEKLIMDSK